MLDTLIILPLSLGPILSHTSINAPGVLGIRQLARSLSLHSISLHCYMMARSAVLCGAPQNGKRREAGSFVASFAPYAATHLHRRIISLFATRRSNGTSSAFCVERRHPVKVLPPAHPWSASPGFSSKVSYAAGFGRPINVW
jgi:hypothetical protein